MSIEATKTPDSIQMSSEKHKKKLAKPDRAAKMLQGEKKKRKRDHTEGEHKTKSKKHKNDKAALDSRHPEGSLESSPFHIQRASLYLPLAPISQKYPLEGLCAEHLSPLILQYYPPFHGVVLSYSNPRLSENAHGDDGDSVLMHNINEYGVSWAWVTADFVIFKPVEGAWLDGYINLQTEGHIGIVCWNLFSASIERKRLPDDWEWRDAGDMDNRGEGAEGNDTYANRGTGYYVDRRGEMIDDMVSFRVKEIESSHDRERGFLAIAGTLLDEKAEEELVEQERSETRTSKENAGRRLGGWEAIGATPLGIPVEKDEANSRKKRRPKY